MDLLKALAVSVLLLSTMKNINARNRDQISLAVYYGSLSPDSEDFIVNQLYPATTALGKYLSLRFIPFGNARFVDQSKIECEYDESECRTNMVHQCVLHIMEEKGKTNLEKVEFLKCEMTTKSALTFYSYENTTELQCPVAATGHSVTDTVHHYRKPELLCPVAAIGHSCDFWSLCSQINNTVMNACVSSPSQGLTMQKNAEYLTKLLSPTSFPAVTINGVYYRELDWNVKRDLIGTLCRIVSMPPCSQYVDEETTSNTESTLENSIEDTNEIY